MKITLDVPVYRSDWRAPPSWDGLRYRLWIAVTPFGNFQQHEWLNPGRNDSYSEGWIPTPLRRIPPDCKEVTDAPDDLLLRMRA